MDGDPLHTIIVRTLSDLAKLVTVLFVIPLVFVLAGPAVQAVMP